MATPMSAERARTFLIEGSRSAIFVTVRADGRPHAVPVWFAAVSVNGTAEIVTDPARVRSGSELIARRYLPAEGVDQFVGYATSPGKVLVVVHPSHTTGVDAVAG
ncbi:pyridoxamine 5'-phosphate oxidase family protein [Amycolatopsis sp. NPDC051373]|uniref:pyridoxamine 5'-phosphate oxidase family protein n=1 Tax=Amycolatopsis sp. NPDC051373 TaxID=3155801 RepID=UPI00344DF8EA